MKGRIVRFNSVPLCRLSLGSAATVSRAVCESSCGHQGGTRIVSQSALLMQRGVPSHSLTFDEAMARWKMCHWSKCHVINWRWRAPHDITQLDAQCNALQTDRVVSLLLQVGQIYSLLRLPKHIQYDTIDTPVTSIIANPFWGRKQNGGNIVCY